MTRHLVVLQTGKVASWTIVSTIQASSPNMVLCDLDRLSGERNALVHMHDPRVFEQYLRETMRLERELVVVTANRDPLRTAISMMFQNIMEPSQPHCFYGTKDQVNKASGRDLVSFFRDVFENEISEYFDVYTRCYGAALGIDAFNLRYGNDGASDGEFSQGRYITMRVHRLADALPRLSRVTGLELRCIVMNNVATTKWYASAYNRFLSEFTPSSDEIEIFYGSRFALTSFSADDLQSFSTTWPTTRAEATAQAIEFHSTGRS